MLAGKRALKGGLLAPSSRLPTPFLRIVTRSGATATAQPEAAPHAHPHHYALNFKAAVDFKYMKDNLEQVEKNCKARNSTANPRKAVELYDDFVRLKLEVDRLRAERNSNSSQMKGKLEKEQRDKLIARGQQLKDELAVVEDKLAVVETQMQIEGQRVPNLTHPAVPIGGEEVAGVVTLVGEKRDFGFPVKDHVVLAEALDMVDFDSASEVSGQKFYYLRNAGALLELALVNWALSRVVGKHGFTPIMTPDLVKAAVLEKCGFQPRGTETQVYSVADSPLCLTGTAEVPLGGIYMDQVLQESDLPIKMAAFGHCFRTEAGAAGAAGKGLYRVHQFSKVEMFVLCTPAQSEALHEELRKIEVELFSELGLHFKVLDMPSGDLGAPAYRKYDVEAWMPGLNRYGEISSASNCTDYQARRLNIRYKPSSSTHSDASGSEGEAEHSAGGKKGGKGGKKGSGSGSGGATEFVHTLNATACAVPRMIVAILENYQQEDGSVVVPEALRPFLGGMDVIRPPPTRKH